MARAFDYSKWDNIELSDDESDLHPNIDKESWFRLKHRTRIEREEREDQEITEYESKNRVDQARINVIQARLKGIANAEAGDDAEYEDTDALQVELKELQHHIGNRNVRIAEIHEKRKWNIDNICKVKEEKTIVNSLQSASLTDNTAMESDDDEEEEEAVVAAAAKASTTASSSSSSSNTSSTTTSTSNASNASSNSSVVAGGVDKKTATTTATTTASGPTVSTVAMSDEPRKREKMAVIKYNDYVIKHEALLEKYSEIADLEASKDFLFKHCDILLHEHAQSYMLLSCLEDEMNGKHKRMKLVCRQSQILSHINELGMSMKRDPRDVILPFFKRIEEKEYQSNFQTAVEDFIQKVQKRAVDKRKEMDADREGDEYEYEGEDPEAVGPGGLNPFQVLKQLPKVMREAFESQDIGRLQKVLSEMNPADAKHWMKQCVDSGLWVAKDPTIFEGEEDEDVEEGEEQPAEQSEDA